MKINIARVWVLALAISRCAASAPSIEFGNRSFELPNAKHLAELAHADSPSRTVYELAESGERYVVVHYRAAQATDDAALLFARGYVMEHLERYRRDARGNVGLLANVNYTLRKAPALLVVTSRAERELCHHVVALRIDSDVLLLAHEGTSKEGVEFLKWARRTLHDIYGMDLPIDLVAIRQKEG